MIIIDTNVLLSFLLTDGITRKIIKENPDVFMSPEHCFEELWEQGGDGTGVNSRTVNCLKLWKI